MLAGRVPLGPVSAGGLLSEMDPTRLRMRYILGIFFAAVATAAVLRHVIHIYVGFSREEIRTISLIAAGVVILLALILFRRKKRQS
jgi:LPXTG-motif cell wall-anchored protein